MTTETAQKNLDMEMLYLAQTIKQFDLDNDVPEANAGWRTVDMFAMRGLPIGGSLTAYLNTLIDNGWLETYADTAIQIPEYRITSLGKAALNELRERQQQRYTNVLNRDSLFYRLIKGLPNRNHAKVHEMLDQLDADDLAYWLRKCIDNNLQTNPVAVRALRVLLGISK